MQHVLNPQVCFFPIMYFFTTNFYFTSGGGRVIPLQLALEHQLTSGLHLQLQGFIPYTCTKHLFNT